MTRAHARTRKQINRAWTTTLHTLITHDPIGSDRT